MKPQKRHIIILFLLIWRFALAQHYTNFSTKNGLPSNHVYTILQDAKGFMWFLTDKGMVKYNGKTFKTFTTKNGLPNNDVWDAFTTPNGKIWYLSKAPSLGYIKNDSVYAFPNKEKNKIINPIYSSQVGNAVYPTETKRFYILKNKEWQSLLNKAKDSSDYWMRMVHQKISFIGFNPKTEDLSLYDKEFKKVKNIPTTNLYGVTGVRGQINDSLFYWALEKKYAILNLNTLKLKQFNLNTLGYPLTKLTRINLVNDEIQISGANFVAKLNKDFEIVNPYFYSEEFKAHFGFIDKSNTIWLATFNKGIYKLPEAKRDVVYKFQNKKIQTFNCVDDQLVVGVYKNGFYNYNPVNNKFNNLINHNEFIYGAYQIIPLKTTFYVSGESLIVIKNGKKRIIDFTKSNKQKTDLNAIGRKLVYYNNNLYGNFAFGINQLNEIDLTVEKEYLQKGCNDFLVFKHQLLIATTNGLKTLKNDVIIDFDYDANPLQKSILSLNKISDSALLINTDGYGSYISDLKTTTLLKGSEFLIVQDAFVKDSAIWLATNTGVLHFEKRNGNYQLLRTYTIDDGLPNNNINTVYATTKQLIVGTDNGLAILPIHQEKEDLLLDVFIESITFNNQTVSPNTILDYKSNNTLDIVANAIDFSEGKTHLYSYKLEPIQTHWTATATNQINFNNLAPNQYVFYLKSGNVTKQLAFSIAPLWWQTLWFKLIVTVLGLIFIVLITRYFAQRSEYKKNQKIIEEKRLSELQLKALRSQMNPHFVFNSLSAIQYFINDNDFETSERYLVKFSKLIRQFFELSKENEISLVTEVNLLKSYLDIEKLRFKEKLNYTIHIDAHLNIKKTKIPTMLLQPIVENAVNHGVFNKLTNGLVTLDFSRVDSNTFKVEISDDGVGFENTKKRRSKKVKSSSVLKDRLHFLNQSGKWHITYSEVAMFPNQKDKGNKSIFIINFKTK